MVNLRCSPKPIIVQINRSAFLDKAISGAVEKRMAYLIAGMTGMVGAGHESAFYVRQT
jgi:hypothetical protein